MIVDLTWKIHRIGCGLSNIPNLIASCGCERLLNSIFPFNGNCNITHNVTTPIAMTPISFQLTKLETPL